jgi:hypothetical protein
MRWRLSLVSWAGWLSTCALLLIFADVLELNVKHFYSSTGILIVYELLNETACI